MPRVTKTLAKALSYDPTTNEAKPFTTHFGAIVGLTLLGTNVIDSVLMPMIGPFLDFITEPKNVNLLGTEDEKLKVISALQNAVNQWKEHFDSKEYNQILSKYF